MRRILKVTAFAAAWVAVINTQSPVQAFTSIAEPVTTPSFKIDKSEKSSKAQGAKARKKSRKPSSKTAKKKTSGKTLKRYVAYRAAHNRVNTSCFPTRLRNVLNKVRARYGTTAIVSSGFRSKRHNRRVGGARRSMHVQCKAADIRVPGVNKYKLARFLKTIPSVGGVGTYGCNGSVHVDVGPKRQWHWRCRRRS
ncbi:MAG: D-Ala-D-Ala carboxypeptidase family metallohydrolase [Hyphomicrobiales bacterium]